MHTTTTNLIAAGRRHLRPLADVHVRRAAAIVLLPLLLATIGALASARPAAPAVPLPTLPPIIILASPTMAGPSIAVSQPRSGLPRAVVAYDAPDGHALGAIEAGRAFTPTVRSGLEWLQIDAADSGLVWVRVAELVDGLASLPDVATPVPPAAPVLVEAAPEPADQPILVEQPRPTVDHAACCEKPAESAADRRRAFNAMRTAEAVAK
jgi:hypothetical protein